MPTSTTRRSAHTHAFNVFLGVLAAALAMTVTASTALGDGPTGDQALLSPYTQSRPLVFAHRGSSKYAPEETLAAFRRAIADGADTLEGDMAQTKDGQIIIIHDDTLSRTTNVEELYPDRAPWNVSDFTLAEVKRLEAGSWFSPKFAGEKIITLREWLRFTHRRVGLYPEIKDPDLYPGIVENVANELRRAGYTSEGRARNGAPAIWIQSRYPKFVRQFHELLPDIPVAAFGADGVVYSYVTASDEVLRDYASWASATLCHPALSQASQIRRIQGFGIHCVSEVSDSASLIDMAVKQRYDVVLTDVPDVARAVIAGKDPLPRRSGVVIDSVVYNPEGSDVAPNGGEYILLRNTTDRSIDISKYSLREYGNQVLHTGSDAMLEAGSFYKVYVGSGTDSATQHFNGLADQVLSDTLTDHVYLYSPKGVVRDIYSYFAGPVAGS